MSIILFSAPKVMNLQFMGEILQILSPNKSILLESVGPFIGTKFRNLIPFYTFITACIINGKQKSNCSIVR